MARSRVGIWLIGAKGGVASTALVGLTALKKGLIGNAGLVSQLPQFESLGLTDWKDFAAIGGHEIRSVKLYDEAMQMVNVSRAIDGEIVQKCKADLDKIDKSIRPGALTNVGSTIENLAADDLRKKRETPRQALDRIQDDLRKFIAANKLDH